MVAGFKSCAIQGCARNAHRKLGGSRGWCQAHYKRWRRYGDPVGGRAPNGDPEQFFQMALEYDGDDCIQWPYSRTKTGYARIWVGDRMRIASRLICQAVYGAAPTPKHHAAHSCGRGNRGCVNPRHLSWKTQVENEADKVVQGTATRGARNGTARLTDEMVRQIRALKGERPQREIADMFGIAARTVSHIHSGTRWRHLFAEAA